MKTLRFILMLVLAIVLWSCKTDPDLFSEAKDAPVIYALLDADADTNFVKITRSFLTSEDPTVVAQNPHANYYPEKLDVRLEEYKNGEWSKEIILDTITIHDKQEGLFVGPSQLLYYTAEPLGKNTPGIRYRYELILVVDGKTITSSVDMVGGTKFRLVSAHMNFSRRFFGTRRQLRFGPAVNAAFYDVIVIFHYKERRYPSTDTIDREFSFIKDRHTEAALRHTLDSDGYYHVSFSPEHFYTGLSNFLGEDTLNEYVIRYITDYPLEVRIEAGGMQLMNYLHYFTSEHPNLQGNPDIGCVGDGAVGLVSSRSHIVRWGSLTGETVPELVARGWRFKFIGGKDMNIEEDIEYEGIAD